MVFWAGPDILDCGLRGTAGSVAGPNGPLREPLVGGILAKQVLLEASKGGTKVGRMKDPLYKDSYLGINPPTFILPFEALDSLNAMSGRAQPELSPFSHETQYTLIRY